MNIRALCARRTKKVSIDPQPQKKKRQESRSFYKKFFPAESYFGVRHVFFDLEGIILSDAVSFSNILITESETGYETIIVVKEDGDARLSGMALTETALQLRSEGWERISEEEYQDLLK